MPGEEECPDIGVSDSPQVRQGQDNNLGEERNTIKGQPPLREQLQEIGEAQQEQPKEIGGAEQGQPQEIRGAEQGDWGKDPWGRSRKKPRHPQIYQAAGPSFTEGLRGKRGPRGEETVTQTE